MSKALSGIVAEHIRAVNTFDTEAIVATFARGAYDGEYDKTNLPKELILTNYFSVRDSKIVSLAIIFNQPSPY